MTHTDRQRPREMVARALFDATPFRNSVGPFEEQSETYQRMCRLLAHAAISKLRDLGYFRHDELALIKQEERAGENGK